MMSRRSLLQGMGSMGIAVATSSLPLPCWSVAVPTIAPPLPEEDVFAYMRRLRGGYDATLYVQILGAANEFKEGDAIVGVAAADEDSRRHTRELLARTHLRDIDTHPLHPDSLFHFISGKREECAGRTMAASTLADLKQYVLNSDENGIQQVLPGLSSDVIACLVKFMTNEELIQVARKVFHPLPGSQIGARGYLGARIQPNSPTAVSPEHLVVTSGRVRAGYRIGEILFADLPGPRAILHVIGERPGTGHHTFSIYVTAPAGEVWGQEGTVDHNITKVVSGVAVTALPPETGAKEVARLLGTIVDARGTGW